MKRIVAHCICPPIPTRQFDWVAFYEGEEERGHYGYGPTKQAAIDDFIAEREE